MKVIHHCHFNISTFLHKSNSGIKIEMGCQGESNQWSIYGLQQPALQTCSFQQFWNILEPLELLNEHLLPFSAWEMNPSQICLRLFYSILNVLKWFLPAQLFHYVWWLKLLTTTNRPKCRHLNCLLWCTVMFPYHVVFLRLHSSTLTFWYQLKYPILAT